MLWYWAFKLLQALVEKLPRRWAYRLGLIAAAIAFTLAGNARRCLEENLRQALPKARPEDVTRLARLNFQNHSKAYADLMQLPSLDVANAGHLLRLYGMEHLDAALARGRGVLVVSVHMGSYELVASIWARTMAPVYLFAEVLEPKPMYDWYRRTRAEKGIRVLPLNRHGLRQLIAALESNAMVVTAIDRDVLGTGASLSFLGRPARIPTGPAALALRLGTPLLPVCVYRLPDDTYQAVGLPPIVANGTGNRDQDVLDLTAKLLRPLEDFIRQHPDQWHVPHRIWDRPEKG